MKRMAKKLPRLQTLAFVQLNILGISESPLYAQLTLGSSMSAIATREGEGGSQKDALSIQTWLALWERLNPAAVVCWSCEILLSNCVSRNARPAFQKK